MITVLGNDGVDHYAIAGQPLVDDPWFQRRHLYRTLLAVAASALLALGDLHKVPRGLHIELFAFVEADDRCFLPTLRAVHLRAANHFLDSRQMLWQRLASPMPFALSWRRLLNLFTPAFCFNLIGRDAGLFFDQQLQLQITQCLAERT